MAFLRNILKKAALTILPESILQQVKKRHYAGTLRSFVIDDEPDLKVVKHLVNPGDTVADIGANIGVYTKFLSQWVGPSGRVYSFEPISPTFNILKSNVQKLGLANVEPGNCAISDRNASLRMEVPSYDSGGRDYYDARVVNGESGKSAKSFVVEAKTLDSLFQSLPSPLAFVKCDVEGHELQCLRGAQTVIRKFRPAWLLEISGDPADVNDPTSEVFRLLRAEGYAAFWFDGARLNKWHPGDNSVNCFFLAPQHLRVLEAFFPFQS